MVKIKNNRNMKRTISVICAAALVMFAACQKEGTTLSKVALTATLEQQVDNGATKTALNSTNNVIWSLGDQIKVHTTDGLETLTLTEGQGTTAGKFSPTTGDNPDYAIYPASTCTSLEGSTFTFTLPATQTYAENSFGPGANVAVAAISGGNMAFKNVCGVLKLQLKGSMKVSKIELTGKSGEKLNGTFTVDVDANPFIGAVKEGGPTEAEKKVTLDCSHFGETSEGAADGGVLLGLATPMVFDIIVPVSAFADGFEAKITDVLGETFYTTLETAEDNTIARSTITKMPSKKVHLQTPLLEGYTALEYIESTGTQYINTGVIPSKNTSYSTSFCITGFSGDSQTVIGSNWKDNLCDRIIISASGHCTYQSNPAVTLINEVVVGTIYEAYKDGNCVGFEGCSSVSFSNYPNTSTLPISIFATLKTSKLPEIFPEYFLHGKLYSAYIYDSTKGSRMIMSPVKRISDNAVGMLDLVSETFFESVGSEAFIAGPELTY